MAVAMGTAGPPSTTGNHSYTGVGFEPVAVMFWSVEIGQGNPSNFFGCATSSSAQWCIWTGEDDQASTYDRRYRMFRDDCCVNVLAQETFTSVQHRASLVSLDSDGFTLNYSTATGFEPVHFMAIGGENISDAHAGKFTAGGSTGTTSITGTGFQPDALIVCHLLSSNEETLDSFSAWGMGFADGSLNQYSTFALGHVGSPPTSVSHIHRTDAVACGFFSGDSYVAQVDSMDSDGFTIDVTDARASQVHGYLAIEAKAAAVGNLVQPDSTGTQTQSTPGFEPAGVLFTWNGVDTPSTSGSTSTPIRPGMGGMTSSTAASISFIHRDDAPFGAYVPDSYINSPEAINIQGIGSQVATDPHEPQGLAEWNSFSMGEFELNWTAVTSGADRAVGWLALPGDIQVNWIPQIYRRVR